MRGEDALDETAACFRVRAIAGLAPEDGVTDSAFRAVVGRLDTVDANEGPERLGVLEDLRAGLGRLEVRTSRSLREQVLDPALDVSHVDPEGGALERSITHAVPPVEHSADLLEQRGADHGGLMPALGDGLKVPLEVRPAELVHQHAPPVVGAVTIRHEDARSLSHQRARGVGVAASVDHEDRELRGDDGPKERAATSLAPSGLVGVLDRRVDDGGFRLLDGCFERRARQLLAANDRADMPTDIVSPNKSRISAGTARLLNR